MTAAALEWRYDPWRERPGRSWGALATLSGGCALILAAGLPAAVTTGLCAALGASLGPALLPWRFRLDDSGATLGRGLLRHHLGWTEIRRAVRARDGVLLSPFERRDWRDPYRALFLPLPRRAGPRLAGDVDRVLSQHGL